MNPGGKQQVVCRNFIKRLSRLVPDTWNFATFNLRWEWSNDRCSCQCIYASVGK